MTRRATLALCAALLGCSGPSSMDAGVDAGPTVTVVETCDRLAAARCELVTRCYPAFNRDAPDECRSLEQSRCLAEYDGLKASFDNNLVAIDVARLVTCEARMKGSACPPSFPPSYPNTAVHPFDDCGWQTGLLIGNVASGQQCDNAVECAPGTLCVKPSGVCRGTCSSFAADGEPCAFGCGPGLRCDDKGDMDSNNDTCAPVKQLNEACASSSECSPELVCNTTCRPRSKENEPCFFDSERLSTCDPGLACDVVPYVDGMIGKCIQRKAEFDACRFHWSCQPGLVCADIDWAGFPLATPGMGSCRVPGGRDSNCQPTAYSVYVGDPCEPGTRCSLTMKQCLTIPKLGETCAASSQVCAGVNVYCKPGGGDMGTCTGPAGQGDRCAFAIDAATTVTIPCSSGFCDTESTLSCRAPFKQLGAECGSDGECTSGRCAVQQDRKLRCAMACN